MALDERAIRLAELVTNYSTQLNSNDVLLIIANPAFSEFTEQIALEARKKGAKILYDFESQTPARTKGLIERLNPKELDAELERKCSLARVCTAAIIVNAETSPGYLKDVSPKKISAYQSKLAPACKILFRQKDGKDVVKWNVVGYPSPADAKTAGMSLEEYTDFVFNACLIDWSNANKQMRQVKQLFDHAGEVQVHNGRGNCLSFSLKTRGSEICCATNNTPDGEVYYAPEENSISGSVYFTIPSVEMGNIIEGIQLKFRNGVVCEWDAKKNKELLTSTILDIKGANRVGEFGIGCNYGITRATKNILFDEKMGGTIHIALGQAISKDLENSGGLNEGDIHWDLVCDLRKSAKNPGGRIYVDGKLVQKDGIWCF
jgi:aminopeptidase